MSTPTGSPTGPDSALEQVTVIIVTYNSAHCLSALGATLATLPHVVVVDNASQDDTAAAVARHLPQALWLHNKHNEGFGRANNRGLQRVSTPYALLLNPDCEITPEAIAGLVAAAHHWPEAAMIAPQIVGRDGTPDINYRWPNTLWKSAGPGADGPCCVGFLCGAAILLNMQAMESVGHFDPDFFLYYEDDDLCWRTFERHLPMLVVPTLRVFHRSRSSSGAKHRWRTEYWRGYHHAQSKIIFAAKHRGTASARRLRRRTLLLTLPLLLFRLALFSPKHLSRAFGRLRGLLGIAPGLIARSRVAPTP